MANLIAGALREYNLLVEVTTALALSYAGQVNFMYVILTANAFMAGEMPPAQRRITVQLEQTPQATGLMEPAAAVHARPTCSISMS